MMFRSGNGRFLCKQLDLYPNVFKSVQKAKYSNVDSQSDEKVVIPPRIERGATDILEALSLTVGMKSTAFHYKYPDDPYFYPLSRFSEKMYALALESGRKSARWIVKENPKFFKNELSEPLIKEFIPKEKETEETKATEETLNNAIKERNVPEAIRLYKSLLEGNIEVSKVTKQCLLELVCFFNSQEKQNVEMEEKWFIGNPFQDHNTWRATDFATELFESMDPSCPLATSTMIQGMLKHNNIDSAVQLYELAKVKKIRLSVGVYNALLSKLNVLQGDQKRDLESSIKDTLKEMSEQNIKPNLGTLNSTLSTIKESDSPEKFKLAQEVMNEFVKLGIEPSLGSFGCVLSCLKGSSYVYFVDSLLASIEHQHYQVLHPTDFKFFPSAMKTIDHELRNSDLAIRLMEMFDRNNNSKFIVNVEDRNQFYRHFCFAIFNNMMIDPAMTIYKSYTLTRFYPETIVYGVILENIRRSKQYHYLVDLWKEMENTRAVLQRSLTKQIMSMANDINTEELKICHAAALVYLNDKNRTNEIRSDTCSNIVISLLKNQDYEKFKSFWDEVQEYLDILDWSENAIMEMYNYGTSQKDVPFLLEILKIGKDANHPRLSEMVTKAFPLVDENDKKYLQQILEESESESESAKSNKRQVSKAEVLEKDDR